MDSAIYIYLKIDKDKACEMIYNKYHKKITGLCFKVLKDKTRVEDVAQDIFVKIFENIDKFSMKSGIGTWIYRVAMNYILNYNKKIDFFLDIDENTAEKEFARQDIRLEMKELQVKIDEALNKLKDDDKKIFILREMEGLSYYKIAEIMELKEGTVKSRIFYIRAKLQELLKFMK